MTLETPIVLNLYAGPGAGKSTTAALTFGLLKARGVRAELVTEYAKELTFEARLSALACQTYIFGKQLWRQERLRGQVDVIVTDSPLLLSLIYRSAERHHGFEAFVRYEYDRFDNINVFLERDAAQHPYQDYGRHQTEDEARALDVRIRQLLTAQHLPVYTHKVTEPAMNVADAVGKLLAHRKGGRL